ncbi:allantoinase AllB [Microbacterium capsulatum]|uniref:allantoinase n=1 Tax=Microbacterium capsulatum TaxID=3041921 RepID=A0ABU0XFX1_9MICO|nr:allantoinase AllB [Microbacterium sp. ASV81]MDQ4213090.1 allantoinase AllB [Microbacterium sp. ASV81]
MTERMTDPGSDTFVVGGGRLVLPERVVDADLWVEDGRIVDVIPRGHRPELPRVPADGLVVMAGMIDTHVHLRDPGHPHRETFASGTRAAARGGVTTVLEMPSGIPAVSDAESWQGKNEIVARKAVVDYGLYGGAGLSNLDRIGEQADAGAVAFKSFMNAPAPTADPGMSSRCLPDDAVFLEAMRRVAATGRVAVVHAENDAICTHLTHRLRAQGRDDLRAHAESRPVVAEEEAVSRAILLAHRAGVRLSIAHVSSAAAVDAIRRAKRNGHDVTAEVCPHHLLRSLDDAEELGPYAKVNPPLRDDEDRAALWLGLRDGTLDFIGTDHAPYSEAEKDRGWESIWDAPPGIHGLEAVLSVLLTEAHDGRFTLPELTRIVSLNAARRFGLGGRKGELRAGADADFVLVDPDAPGVLDRRSMESVSRDAARFWDGRRTVGCVLTTFVRGTRVADRGVVVGNEGFGRLVRPERAE